ncbi:50S ribosomal protein L20 [Candidatus Phytoplasma melaleucae]|uniref:Large ribosomal subunit protein bL20 n=1 Tax=Candidatus Phytoplasma melaleucae TaxID=2982630 RepID=A0ABT9DEW4_9MOLU|nr:50S ribosomal protein L20 ['Melaleuca sp.' phytoplasma]MDO8168171.1 50S ribosomal protein L20 ['Melaleuca sp.' phytoplasma]
MVKTNFVVARHQRRKKILKLAKGYVGSKSTLYKTAHEQVMRAWQHSYIGRKRNKRDWRQLWIRRINAGCFNYNIKYSRFIHGLSLAGIVVNRKILSDMAFKEPEMFQSYVELAKQNLLPEKNLVKQEEPKLQSALQREKLDNIAAFQPIGEKTYEHVTLKNTPNEENNLILAKMLLVDLKELAKKHQIENISKLRKAELVRLLEEKLANK